jgi:cation diffusion facilitator CzcD-associated flavoprotein CzcO
MPTPLAALEREVARDLARTSYPDKPWVPERLHNGTPVLDVVVIGAGQGGLAVGFGLRRDRIDRVLVIDQAAPGEEGPWATFARMPTLRTPKHVTGPDLGVPSLTPEAWYTARFGADAWKALGKIPRLHWQAYLDWFRTVTKLPVRHGCTVGAIEPVGDLWRVPVSGPTGEVWARRVVLATGIEGSGAWEVPDWVHRDLPRERWVHTSDRVDYTRFRGRRVAVLGAGASAFDCAGSALEAGAAEVRLYARRATLPTVNPYRWMEQTGFLKHYWSLPDTAKWQMMRQIWEMNQPPTGDSIARCRLHGNFALHTGSRWTGATVSETGIAVQANTPVAPFDDLILGTGFVIDLARRPELAAVHQDIATWADCFTPPSGESHAVLATYPYLAPDFSHTPKPGRSAPHLARLHSFTFGAMPSGGLSGASISGMKFGAARLVEGIGRSLWLEDQAQHVASLLAYNSPELADDLARGDPVEGSWAAD